MALCQSFLFSKRKENTNSVLFQNHLFIGYWFIGYQLLLVFRQD